MPKFRFALGLCCVAALAACQKAPEPIKPQPIFNKYGDVVGCEGGTYVPGALDMPCMPPPEDCDPQATAGAVPCLPPSTGRDPNGSGTPGRTPNNPPGAAAP